MTKVAKFAQHRAVDPDGITGVEALASRLQNLGFMVDWSVLCSSHYMLPQDRPRVYVVGLRCTALSPEKMDSRRKDLQDLMVLIRRLAVRTPSDLDTVLPTRSTQAFTDSTGNFLRRGRSRGRGRGGGRGRSGRAKGQGRHEEGISEDNEVQPAPVELKSELKSEMGAEPTSEALSEGSAKPPTWPQDHDRYIQKHLMDADLSQREQFGQDCEELQSLCPRARDVLFLKLTHWAMRNELPWASERWLITAPGQSVSWCPMQRDRFPCITPKGLFVMFYRGKARVARGLDFLAVQGIQAPEVSRWKFDLEDETLLQDLAGNAFSANVFAAVFLAALVYRRPS